MMKLRKWLSLFLAVALLVSLTQRSEMTAFATEPSGTETADENVPVPEAAPTETKDEAAPAVTTPDAATPGETTPDTTTPTEVTPDETTPDAATPTETTPRGMAPDAAAPTETTPDVTAPDAAAPTETAPGGTTPDAATPSETTPDGTAPTETTPDGTTPDAEASAETAAPADAAPQEDQVDVPTVMSLFPYEEKRVSVYLNDYSKEQLAAMPVNTLLDMLLDSDGNKITVPADAEILCGYQKDDDGYPLDLDSYWKVERDGTVDLSYKWDDETSYQMRLIIGEANQLAKENIRYIVTVHQSDQGRYGLLHLCR